MKRFETTNMHEASAYIAAGHVLADLDRIDSYAVNFVFNETEAFTQAKEDYWADKLMVSALKLSMTQDNLARRCKSLPNVPNGK